MQSPPNYYKWKAMGISDWRNKFTFFKNGCWVCGIHTAGKMWLRRSSDKLLVSPFNVRLLSIKPVMRIMAIINWEILFWCTNKFSELWCQGKWWTATMRRINSLSWSLKMVKDRKSVTCKCIVYMTLLVNGKKHRKIWLHPSMDILATHFNLALQCCGSI